MSIARLFPIALALLTLRISRRSSPARQRFIPSTGREADMRHCAAFAVTAMVVIGGTTIPAQQPGAAPEPARLTGIVLADDTGLPIANASVRVTGGETRAAVTGEDGRFEVDNIPPGSHLVSAVMAGYMLGTAGQRHPADVPTLVEFQSRSVRNVEIRLTPLGIISGTVVDEKGQPVAGAEIVVSRVHSREGCRGCRAVTDAGGRYRLTGLRDGRYRVVAFAPPTGTTAAGDAAAPVRPAPIRSQAAGVAPPARPLTYYPGTELPAQAATVAVAAGTQVDASFALVRSTLTRIAGTILDSRGNPVRDYLVMLDGPPAQPQSLLPRYIEVGADGRFELKDVAPGDYTLLVRDQERFVLIGQTGGTVGQNFKGELADRRIQVPGDGLDDLHIVTRPGFELSGTLLMNGQPLRNLTRAVIAVSPTDFTLHPASGASVLVEADGTFRMPNLSGTSLVRALNLPQGLMVQRISAGSVEVGDFGVEMVQNLNVDVIVGRQSELR